MSRTVLELKTIIAKCLDDIELTGFWEDINEQIFFGMELEDDREFDIMCDLLSESGIGIDLIPKWNKQLIETLIAKYDSPAIVGVSSERQSNTHNPLSPVTSSADSFADGGSPFVDTAAADDELFTVLKDDDCSDHGTKPSWVSIEEGFAWAVVKASECKDGMESFCPSEVDDALADAIYADGQNDLEFDPSGWGEPQGKYRLIKVPLP